MICWLSENDKELALHVDRNGKILNVGDTFRLYISHDEFYGRPIVVEHREGHIIGRVQEGEDAFGLSHYFDMAVAQGWDTFEIFND